MKAGAGMMPKSNPFSEADFAIPEKIPSSSSSTERATMPGSAAEGSGLAAQEARAFPAEMGRHPCSNEEKDKAMLLKALETAQVGFKELDRHYYLVGFFCIGKSVGDVANHVCQAVPGEILLKFSRLYR